MKYLVVLAAVAGPMAAFAKEPIELTRDEFKMYRHYLNAKEDPRVQKIKPEQQDSAIAKDARFKLRDMLRAVERGSSAGDLKQKCESNLREGLGGGELKEKVAKIEIDTSAPHAVAYVQWLNDDPKLLSQEAAIAAATAADACPIVSSVQVWATAKTDPKARVFQALISSDAAAKINLARVKGFAETRYVRLFEKLKSVANGDDLTVEN